MRVSRRSFLRLLSAVPALSLAYPGVDQGPLDEIVDLKPEEFPLSDGIFATTGDVVQGAANIYRFVTSGAAGVISLVRDSGAICLRFAVHRDAFMIWSADPGNEICVPPGGSMRLVMVPLGPQAGGWMPCTYYRRPG